MTTDTTPVKSVESALSLGLGLAASLSFALSLSLTALAGREGWNRVQLSMLVNGHQNHVLPTIRDRLAELVGTTREEVDRWIADERRRCAARAEHRLGQ